MISLYIYNSCNCVLCIVWLVILCIDLYEPKDSLGLNIYIYVCFVITIAVLIHTVLLHCDNLIKDIELFRCKILHLSGNRSKISATVDIE